MKIKRHSFFLLLLYCCTFFFATEAAPSVLVRMWGTYFGGTTDNWLNSLTYHNGSIYGVGITGDSDLPVTPNAFQMKIHGSVDAYLCKFNLQGELTWCTYYGGNGYDDVRSILVDPNGFIYIYGSTGSTDLSTQGAWQGVYGGGSRDGILAKFDSNGNRLWCTYIGGEGDENLAPDNTLNYSPSMCFDENFNNFYIIGNTTSDSGIATPDAFQKNRAGLNDCFIMKFDKSGKRIWGTYLGGNDQDGPMSMIYHSDGYLVCTGSTRSTDCFGDGGFQQTNGGGIWDAFIVKIDTNGKKIWSTFYGGEGSDYIECDKIDSSGNLFLDGGSSSKYRMGTNGQSDTCKGDYDAFISKFNSEGSRLWSTYVGSKHVDAEENGASFGNNCYTIGWTGGKDFPNNAGYMDLPLDADTCNGFILKFDSNGTVIWSSLFGGNGYEWPQGITLAPDSTIFVCGGTLSTDGIAENGFNNTYKSIHNYYLGFLMKFYELKITTNYPNGSAACAGDSIFVPYSFSRELDYEKTFELVLSDTSGNFTNPLILNTIKIKSSGIASAKIPLDLPGSVQYKMKIEGSDNVVDIKIYAAPSAVIIGEEYVCPSYDMEYKTDPNPDFINHWMVENGIITDSTHYDRIKVRWTNPGVGKITLIQSVGSTGCSNSSSKTINILFKDTKINGNDFICLSDKNQYYSTDTNGVEVKWQISGGKILSLDSGDVINVEWIDTQNAWLKLIKTGRNGGCQDSVTMNVKVNLDSLPTPEINGAVAVCSKSVNFYTTNYNSLYSYKWICKNGTIIGSDSSATVTVQWGDNSMASSISVVESNKSGCNSVNQEEISVNGSALSITGENLICPYELYQYSVKKFPGTELKWKTVRGTILDSDTTETVTVAWNTSSLHTIKVVQTTLPDGCTDSVSVTVRKNVPSAKVKIPDMTEDVREQRNKTTKIPVILEDGTCLFGHDSTLTDSIIAILRVNKSLFLPKHSDNVKDSIAGEWRIITFQGKADTFAIGKPIISIEGYVLLGDIVSTPIVLDTIIFKDYSLKPTLSNGNLTLLGISNSGGLRLIKSNNFNFINLYPNPAESKVNLVIYADMAINSRLILFDELGNEVQQSKLTLKPGRSDYEMIILKELKTGIYSIIISSDDDTQTKNLIIIK